MQNSNMQEIEVGKIICDIVTENAEALFNASKSFFTDKSNQLKARLSSTFTEYIRNIERKYSATKTIIYRDTPQLIKSFYEPIDLHNDTLVIANPCIDDFLRLKAPVIITGTGGSGKSTLLKYLLLDSLQHSKFIPLFVELRLIEQEQKTILNYISDTLHLSKVNLGPEYLKQAFEHGNFLFLLDGFDELSQQYAQSVSMEIDSLTQMFPRCHFILTSRPGQEFISWSNFIELRTQPLTVQKAISLVERLNFDSEIKENFVKELKGNLYETHRSFFENPLLLSIMLITFRDSASIPSELHNFYSLAFEALYYRHDASKTFKRPTLTSLPVNKGKDIMSAFSLITYLNSQTIFNSTELREILSKAMKLSDCDCAVGALVTDLQSAYCMLLQDGLKYQYTHRSFQEYFAACYLVAANDETQTKLINLFSEKADTDITLTLAYGMNTKMLEEKLILPFLQRYRNTMDYDHNLTLDAFKRFAISYFERVEVIKHGKVRYLSLSISRSDGTMDKQKKLDLSITRLIFAIYSIETKFNGKDVVDVTGISIDDLSKLTKIPR